MQKEIEVFGRRGDGSDIAEAFLILADIPYRFVSLDYDNPGVDRERLLKMNPLGQVPTLRLPDGTILTESLAIAAYAQSRAPHTPLIPKNPELIPLFWRWATLLVAAVYPTFTYGDNPSRWVNAEAAPELRKSTDERCKQLWRAFEAQAQQPYFLGQDFSAIDIYLKVMAGWRPGKAWFQKETPRLLQIQERVGTDPRLQILWKDPK